MVSCNPHEAFCNGLAADPVCAASGISRSILPNSGLVSALWRTDSVNITEELSSLDGHDQLAALMEVKRHPPIGETLEFYLVELERGRVVFEGTPTRRVFNPIGSVHGGYAATLLDSACGCAVHSSLAAGHGYTTLELKIAYHRALTDASGPVRAEGKVVSLGRRVGFSEARLLDAKGRLCASATSTLLIFPLDTAS